MEGGIAFSTSSPSFFFESVTVFLPRHGMTSADPDQSATVLSFLALDLEVEVSKLECPVHDPLVTLWLLHHAAQGLMICYYCK